MTTILKPCPECRGIMHTALLSVDSFDVDVECEECDFVDDTTHGYLDEENPILDEIPC